MVSRKNAIFAAGGLGRELEKRMVFDDPLQEAHLNLVRTHSLLTGSFARLFRKHGISEPQYNALRILRGQRKPINIHQIVERMVAQQTDISRLIVRLDRARLVKREPCAEDRRIVWIRLTSKGKALLKKLERPVEQLHQSQFQRLSQRELGRPNELLIKARQ